MVAVLDFTLELRPKPDLIFASLDVNQNGEYPRGESARGY